MYREYIDKLVTAFKRMQIISSDGRICENYEEGIESLVEKFIEIREKKKKVFFIGNGGSAAIASHMTADFMKNGKLNTSVLYDNSVITCIGNDYGYDFVFSKPLEFLFTEDDLLVAISSSGNSMNILNAIKVARQKGGEVITFSGFKDNNKIKNEGNWNVFVPIEHYGIVETIHVMVLQQIVDMILEMDESGNDGKTSSIS